MDIQFEDLLLEKISKNHIESIFKLFSSSELTRYFASGPDKNLDDSANRIKKIITHWDKYDFGDFIVKNKKNSEIIGFGGLHYKVPGGKVNISYVVNEKHWREGLGSKICKCLLNYGFNTLKLNEIIAEIDPLNVTSINLIEKQNFKLNRRTTWNNLERLEYIMTPEKFNKQ